MSKKTPVPVTTVTRNVHELRNKTGNLYKSVAIISKRADQIQRSLKEEISRKMEEFSSYSDSLEEVTENKEQIELSRQYERMPKPTLLATQEFLEGKLIFKEAESEPSPSAAKN
ncbi:MAG: DNA-directed RNA polymerase subunit omega [Flavobacteriales bacterium]|nr:DNA-directed RNA polymerase subunit omega [Flavobacteriales bacterium]MCX7651062.1 DNA-directed RNA polymerase subunit omega [Flavobacteriales bacterium]MDW8432050.1 DNA-directed RNA polymerase subunit omega [Flavobacteriales bacterium]